MFRCCHCLHSLCCLSNHMFRLICQFSYYSVYSHSHHHYHCSSCQNHLRFSMLIHLSKNCTLTSLSKSTLVSIQKLSALLNHVYNYSHHHSQYFSCHSSMLITISNSILKYTLKCTLKSTSSKIQF